MRRRRVDSKRERGAALVEAAFVTPVFFVLLFGIMEFGLLFRDSLTTSNAAQQGARAAGVAGDNGEADYLVLRSVEHGIEAMGLDKLDYVVIFRATGPDDVVPPVCLTASRPFNPSNPSAPACNRYTAADFFKEIEDPATGVPTGIFGCASGSIDRFWCPDDRETSLTAGTDYLGIHVQTRHAFITGLFGDGSKLTETQIVRLEPDAN